MVRKLFQLRRAPILILVSLALTSAGCLFSPGKDDGGPGDETRLDRSSIDGSLDYLETVWKQKLYDKYEDILHDEYEFFPRNDDAAQFPWLEGDSWGRTVELGIANNMFDPNFSGEKPPVDQITITLNKQNEVLADAATNRWEVTCQQVGQVLVGPVDGFAFDTRVKIEFVPDPDQPGLWQIIRQTELDPSEG